MKSHVKPNQDAGSASLLPELLDRLAGLVVAKLITKNGTGLLPKQGAVGSNPITRSTPDFSLKIPALSPFLDRKTVK